MPLGERAILGGRYRLLSQVGRGGMGTVWHAHDELLDRDVAVKAILFPPELPPAEYDVVYQTTLREARLAARLSHPAIVTIHDVVEEDSRPWIVMELIHARSLKEQIDQDGALEPFRTAEIGLQIANALIVAHEAGVLHRDVKPANILVRESRPVRAVLTDFGVARGNSDATITHAGTLTGSPAYIAPERARGSSAAAASDLWSLGVTLYSAVEGRSPFERPETVASLIAVLNDDPAPMEKAGPLRPVIEGLLQKNPDERLTAEEATAMLEQVVAAHSDEPARSTSSDAESGSAGRGTPTKPFASMPSARPRGPKINFRLVLLVATLAAVVGDVIIFTVLR